MGHVLVHRGEVHRDTQIRFVGPVAIQGIAPTQSREGVGQVNIQGVFEDFANHAFSQPLDVALFDERHLDIQLGKFGLAIGAQVLVAETARDLVVAVHARHHQQLLEQLG